MKTPITVRIETELLFEARRPAREAKRTPTDLIETVIRQRLTHGSADRPAHVS